MSKLLMATDNAPADGAKLHLQKCELFVRRVEMNPDLKAAIDEFWLSGNSLKFPLDWVQTHMLALPQGIKQIMVRVEEVGTLPDKLFAGLLSNSAATGQYNLNCTRYEHKDVEFMNLELAGESVGPAFEPDFTKKCYTREYNAFLKACGKGAGTNESNDITYEKFADGNTIFAFDCRPEQYDSDGVHPIKKGSIVLNIKFRTELTAPCNLFIYRQNYGSFEIDFEQNVHVVGASVL